MAALNTKIVLRNDTKANWDAVADKVKLLAGEIGIEKDTGLFKIGNGTDFWKDLPYANEGTHATHYEVTAAGTQTDEEAIAAKLTELGAEAALDDIAIVKREIADGKVSHTAYVYNGTAWAAMDGNYSAANVYLNEDVTVTTQTGELKQNAVVEAGTSLQDMLVQMLSQSKDPSKTDPSVSAFTVKDGGATDFEAGSTVTPKWDATFNAGSYGTGYKSTVSKENIVPVAGTGVTVTAWDITLDGISIGTTEDGTSASFVMGDNTIIFKATATHTAGNYALTNLNKLPETDVQIEAGSKSKTATMTSYRKMFAGGVVDKDAAITSAVIRGLGTGVKASAPTSADKGIEFKANVGDTKLILAYPKSLTTKTPKFEYFTLSWGTFTGFEAETATVQVADKRGGENGLKEYTVYTYTPTGAFEADTKFRVYFA
jgi:hypothetical protein